MAELHLLQNDIEVFSKLTVGTSYEMTLLRVQGDRNSAEGYRLNVSWYSGFKQIHPLQKICEDRAEPKQIVAELKQINQVKPPANEKVQ